MLRGPASTPPQADSRQRPASAPLLLGQYLVHSPARLGATRPCRRTRGGTPATVVLGVHGVKHHGDRSDRAQWPNHLILPQDHGPGPDQNAAANLGMAISRYSSAVAAERHIRFRIEYISVHRRSPLPRRLGRWRDSRKIPLAGSSPWMMSVGRSRMETISDRAPDRAARDARANAPDDSLDGVKPLK